MAKHIRKFVAGSMNKSVDERLLPPEEYVHAENVRLGSTELTEIGAVENSKGNLQLTTLEYNNVPLGAGATCIGAFEDGESETMYWFVHDPTYSDPPTYSGVVDLIVSYDTKIQLLTYHVVSTSVLNFNASYLINGINKIDDLLFFTDDYNPPRKINVKSTYSQPAANVDQITEVDISVIKAPPVTSPTIETSLIAGGENYIEDTFICFAYRYRYADGEYSALSQFTEPAFTPKMFFVGVDSYLNDGMENAFNNVEVSINTGSSYVKAIDVVFKEADSNNLFVIDTLEKSTGINDNITYTLPFSNGEIYTVMRSDEILRLYDNVPHLSKAQTLFGNRLMYGNYVEGHDLNDVNNIPIRTNYRVGAAYEDEPSLSLPVTYMDDDIAADPSLPFVLSVPNGTANFDVSGVESADLNQGAIFQFVLNVSSWGFSNQSQVFPNPYSLYTSSADFQVVFTYTLNQNYASLADCFAGGVPNSQWRLTYGQDNFQEDPNEWQNGLTFTDIFNDSVPTISGLNGAAEVSVYRATRSYDSNTGITNFDPLNIEFDSATSTLSISPTSHQYQRVASPSWNYLFQYFNFASAYGYFVKTGSLKSLHSNRDYQVGIVYQDEYARQSTALVSLNNSMHIPASQSTTLNHLKVTIPTDMRPPSWAERYKFVLKPSQGPYEVIYARLSFVSPQTGMVWIKLEGEQTNKLTEGQRLVVKTDTSGPLNSPVYCTVLEIKSQPENFIDSDVDPPRILQPSGVYMRTSPTGWTAYSATNAVLGGVQRLERWERRRHTYYPLIYPLFTQTEQAGGTYTYENWSIPTAATVTIATSFYRRYANPDGNPCGTRQCVFNTTVVSTQDYTDFKDFWLGENINVGENSDCDSGEHADTNPSGGNGNMYDPLNYNIAFSEGPSDNSNPYSWQQGGLTDYDQFVDFNNRYRFVHEYAETGGTLWLQLETGTPPCFANARYRSSEVKCMITVVAPNGDLIFETIPQKVADGIYYEGADSYPITGGNHMSGTEDGDVNQTSTTEGVVNLGFFNCFSFGNGAESYKILDSLVGNYFTLGNRSTSVSTQDYKAIRREASITYSDRYVEQSNVNGLNSFNLGLANYKDCEVAYGPIQVLHPLRTDLLTLQEDRITYVQVAKTLLTSASGGGVVTSVPEILGNQVARVEEYGISQNPESFASYGRDMYFTDAKRSSVIRLTGGVGAGDSLSVVSEIGMRSWFRDLFNVAFNTQKLGGYDPYMNEYVLGSNTTTLPETLVRYECGRGANDQSPRFEGLSAPYSYIIDAGLSTGAVTITVNATPSPAYSATVSALYNGVTTTNSGTGTFSVTVIKNIPNITDITVTVTPDVVSTDSVTTIGVSCPLSSPMKVYAVCVNTDYRDPTMIHNEHHWEEGAYVSPSQSNLVTFEFGTPNYNVSQFQLVGDGGQGFGSIPTDGSTVTINTRKIGADNFSFNPAVHEFKYLTSTTEYNLASSLLADPNIVTLTTDSTQAPTVYSGDFTMPTNTDPYLYLIYDYRDVAPIVLCYSNTTGSEVRDFCCECSTGTGCTPFLTNAVPSPPLLPPPNSAAACALSLTSTMYHSGSEILPSLGDIIYSGSSCSSGETALQGFYKITGNNWIQVGGSGTVLLTGNC
jgi:hypothetical protein